MKCRKKILLSIATTLIVCAFASVISFEYYLQSNKYSDDVVQTEIYSKIMDENREVIIHLPENYKNAKHRKYPVMYILDGTSQDGPAFVKIDLLSKINQFPEAIVVGIPNTSGNRSRDFTPSHMKIDLDEDDSEMGNGKTFLEFIEKELIPYVDKNYRTDKIKTLSGNSRGGLFVLYALTEKPDLFDGYICYSPAFWRENTLIAKKLNDFLYKNSLQNKFIYMSLGDKENDKMKKGFETIRNLLMNQLSKDSEVNQVDLHFDITQNANHGNNSYKSTIFMLNKLNDFLLPK